MAAIWLYQAYVDKSPPAKIDIEGLATHGSPTLIVFVHGLCGDPRASFTARNAVFWPTLMASDKEASTGPALSTLRYALLGYTNAQGRLTIPVIADKMREALNSSPDVKAADNIIIVAHSFGGLAMMDLLPRLGVGDELLDKIKAVFLMGTPAQGSPLGHVLASLAALLHFDLRCAAGIHSLRTIGTNDYIESISRYWNAYVLRRTDIGFPLLFCGVESRAVSGLVTVVPQEYTLPNCARQTFDVDHQDLVKPSSLTDDVHTWVRANVRETLARVEKRDKEKTLAASMAKQLAAFLEVSSLTAALDLERKAKNELDCEGDARMTDAGSQKLRARFDTLAKTFTIPIVELMMRDFSLAELQAMQEQGEFMPWLRASGDKVRAMFEEGLSLDVLYIRARASYYAARNWIRLYKWHVIGESFRATGKLMTALLERIEEAGVVLPDEIYEFFKRTTFVLFAQAAKDVPLSELRATADWLKSVLGKKQIQAAVEMLSKLDLMGFDIERRRIVSVLDKRDFMCIPTHQ